MNTHTPSSTSENVCTYACGACRHGDRTPWTRSGLLWYFINQGRVLFTADFLLGVVIGTQCCYFLSVDLDFSVLVDIWSYLLTPSLLLLKNSECILATIHSIPRA